MRMRSMAATLLGFVVLLGAAGAPAAGPVNATEGIGYGRTEDAARLAAAADLAAAIQVRVKAVVESCTSLAGRRAEDCGSRVINRSATDLPLLGLQYAPIPGAGEAFGVRALLVPASSAPLYEQQLARLRKEFAAQRVALSGAATRRERHEWLTRQLATLRAIQDHRLVAAALGVRAEEAPASEAALTAERAKLESSADSIAFAAQLLMKDLEGTLVAAEPLRPADSREVTPLGSAIGDALRAEMTGRSGPPTRLTGEYRLLDNGDADIVLEVREGRTGALAGVRGVRLLKSGYRGYRATPLAPDFERLLRQGEAISGDFRAELVTSVGASALRFRAGETLRLAARLSRAGYFYVVGHVVRPDGQFSYLLPLQDGDSEARFIRHVPADQANHYVEIGEFGIEAPFGAEHLQIIASTSRPGNALPPYRYDPQSGYYVLDGSKGNVRAGLSRTRGLKPRVREGGNQAVAESTLTFVTLAK